MITHLKLTLLDRHGNPSSTQVLPVAEAISAAGEFIRLLGTDPDELGAAAAAGRVEFEPVRDPATISGPLSKREREILSVMLHGVEDNLTCINHTYAAVVDADLVPVTEKELRLLGNRLLRAAGLRV